MKCYVCDCPVEVCDEPVCDCRDHDHPGTVVVIHGSSGAGKSYPVKRLIESCALPPVWVPPGTYPNKNKSKDTICGYEARGGRIFIAGAYRPESLTGGGDTLTDGPNAHRAWMASLVRPVGPYRVVLYESLFGAMESAAKWHELDVPQWHLFLDTPLEVCRERVRDRRSRGRQAGRPWNEAATVDKNWHRVQALRPRFEAAFPGRVETLPWQQPTKKLVEVLDKLAGML